MSKTLVVVGFGPGVSTAVAERFGAAGYAVALVARNAARLAAGVDDLTAKGVVAASVPADAGDPVAIAEAVRKASAALGPVGVLHWNAFGGERIDLLTAGPAAVRGAFDVAVVGLLAAAQAALPDLKASGDGAVLITNGAFGDLTPMMDQFAVALNAVSVALGNAAKAKLAGLLSARLKEEGVYVGEVTIAGAVKGTGSDNGSVPTIDPAVIAEAFWDLFQARGELRARVGG